MDSEQRMVKEFHEAFGIASASQPVVPSWDDRKLRLKLIYEEFLELCDASGVHTDLPESFEVITDGDCNLVEVADALADISYVVKGSAITYGIDMEPVFAEVHRSNMSKRGGHKRDDGKWVKPASYSPAQIGPILEQQAVEVPPAQ